MLLWLLLACPPVDDAVTIEVSATDHPAVLRVGWQAEAQHAEVTWTDSYGSSHVATASADGDRWEALLVVGAQTTIELAVVSDGEVIGEASAETAGDPPEVSLETEGQLSAPVATTLLLDDAWYIVALGVDGRLRWWQDVASFDLACVRVRQDADGLWTSAFDVRTRQEETEAVIQQFAWDGTELQALAMPGHHHDFDLLSDGSMVLLGYEPLALDEERTVDNDHLYWRSPDGEMVSLFDVASTWPADAQALGEDGAVLGWANHLDVDDETVWVSLRDLNRVVGVQLDGTLVGTLGDGGDWHPNSPFASQHGGSATQEGLLLHDNAGTAAVRVVEYALGDGTGDAQLIWEYQPDEDWSSPALGDAIRLDNGNTLISWGIFSRIEELDVSGETTALLTYDEQLLVGYLTPLDADF